MKNNPNLFQFDTAIESIREKMNQFYGLSDNSDLFFKQLLKKIFNLTGVDLTLYRESYLKRRLYFRLQKIGVHTYKKYLEYLDRNPDEANEYIKVLTIHVTEFFRDVTPFRYLEKVLIPKIASQKSLKDRTIRILSAPCATGEEAYSVAIIVHFLKKKGFISNPVEIHATDIDAGSLEFAQRGIYSVKTMKNISQASIRRNFDRIGEDRYRIKPEIKKFVKFSEQDLIKPFKTKPYDLIICRNFLIYISKENQMKILRNLTENLKVGGYLMLGKTEGFPLLDKEYFEPENIREHIYRFHHRSNILGKEDSILESSRHKKFTGSRILNGFAKYTY